MNFEKQEHETTLAALRRAIDEGDASGIADGDVFARIREKLRIAENKPARDSEA